MCFGLGVAGYIQERYDVDASECDVLGTSIGNISALCLLLKQKPIELLAKLHRYINLFLTGTPSMGGCGSLEQLREALWDWLPDDVHKIVGGTCYSSTLHSIVTQINSFVLHFRPVPCHGERVAYRRLSSGEQV